MKFYNNSKEFGDEVSFMVLKYIESHKQYSDSIDEIIGLIDKSIEELINVNNGIAIKEV